MRSSLHQFFRPEDRDFSALWEQSDIVFDASVLLNIYGYSEDTRDELLSLLHKFADRVFLPHQFALEYARNRSSTIIKQINNYTAAENDFTQIFSRRFQPKTEHPYLSDESLAALQKIRNELSEGRKRMENLISSDEYADVLIRIFDGKVGTPPTNDEIDDLHTAAADRFQKKTPPGYKDADKKDAPECYGDFIAWSQILLHAKETDRSIILVIDDAKEDWWQIEGSRTIGPRPELLDEFRRTTNNNIWLYNSASFLDAAANYGKVAIQDAVIEEVGARLEAQNVAHAGAASAKPMLLRRKPYTARGLQKPSSPKASEQVLPGQGNTKMVTRDED